MADKFKRKMIGFRGKTRHGRGSRHGQCPCCSGGNKRIDNRQARARLAEDTRSEVNEGILVAKNEAQRGS